MPDPARLALAAAVLLSAQPAFAEPNADRMLFGIVPPSRW